MKEKTKKTKKLIKCQSAAEMAIFGSLILIIFGTILSYGQRFDFRQHVKMEAFRRALQEAYYRNASVSYTYKRHSRMMDLFSAFGLGQPKDAQASASVMWVKGLSGIQDDDYQAMHRSFSLYNINESVVDLPKYPKTIIDRTGNDQNVWVPVGVYAEDIGRRTKYSGITEEKEGEEEIQNIRTSQLSDELRITLHTRFDKSESDERDNPIDRYSEYIYEGDYWQLPEEDFYGHIAGNFRVEQVAEIEDNRIYFRAREPGEAAPKIKTERTWTTSQ